MLQHYLEIMNISTDFDLLFELYNKTLHKIK